jgi:hypothetical protein
MVARDAHQQHSALHTDRPDQLVALNKGVLHFWHFAKYAVAFPRMSRSILTRPTRLATADLHLLGAYRLTAAGTLEPAFPLRLDPVEQRLLNQPRLRAAAAMLWPDSTSRTASCLNSSVYCARVDLVIFVSLVDSHSFS